MEWGLLLSSIVVMTVTPVANSDIAFLKSSLLTKVFPILLITQHYNCWVAFPPIRGARVIGSAIDSPHIR